MADDAAATFTPIRSDDVPWIVAADSPRFTLRYRHLSRAALGDKYRVGVAIEELGPGMLSAPAHYHMHEEEHVYVLEGTLTVRLGAERHPMQGGDYICFPAGQRAGHCLINTSAEPCRYVLIGEHRPRDEVVVYTDSNKVLVRAVGGMLDLGAKRSYWDGEDTGQPAAAPTPAEARLPEPQPHPSPQRPIPADDVPWTEEGEGRAFRGRSRHLTHAAVGPSYHVGVVIESPDPGCRLAPRHYHMLEEEHALVLEGEVTLLLGEERHVMRPGDYVCFPAGRTVGHSFVNSGTGPCAYLMVGEHNPNEVCVYPDSNKVMVRALRREADIFDMAAARGYWDGEATE